MLVGIGQLRWRWWLRGYAGWSKIHSEMRADAGYFLQMLEYAIEVGRGRGVGGGEKMRWSMENGGG